MADQVTETPDQPDDFASVALRAMTTDEAAAKKEASAPVKTEAAPVKTETKGKIPEELFNAPAKKDDPTPVPVTDELETSKIAKPEFKDPKRAAQWDELHGKASTFEKQAKENAKKATELEAKIKEFEAKGKDTEALQTKLVDLEKQNQEYLALVRQVNVELDPEFRAKHIDGRKKLIDAAKTIVDESGGNPSDVETALNLTGKARVEALATVADGMSSFQQGRLGRIIDELSNLDAEALSKRTSPDKYLEQRAKEEEARQFKEVEERNRIANSAYESAVQKASSELEVLRRVEGMDEWNKQGQEILSKAKELWTSNRDPEVAARKIIDGFSAPVYRQLFLDQRTENASIRKELEEAKAELKKLYGNGPRINGSPSSNNGAPMDFATQATGLMNGSIQVGNQR